MTASEWNGSRTRYSTVAIALHWAIALLILANLALGWRLSGLKGLAQFQLIQLHKSIGITVLALTLVRIAWRLTHRPPPLPAATPAWERAAAHGVHIGFYALMLALPLSGWLMTSASPLNLPTLLYKTIPFPHVPGISTLPFAQKMAIEKAADTVHVTLTWIAWALIALHLGAVVKHFLQRDGIVYRMIPFAFLRSSGSSRP